MVGEHKEEGLEALVKKPGFASGFKLGAGYVLDPFGAEIMESWENAAVNGKPLHDNHSKTAFDVLSEDAHEGNSISKYVGIGTGMAAAVAGLAILPAGYPVSHVLVSTVVVAGDVWMTYRHYTPSGEHGYKPTFGDGLKGGFGIGLDPAGFYLENLERNFVNGKGIDDNRIKSLTQVMTRDARKGDSVAKYAGGVVGFGLGAAANCATFGSAAVIAFIYDVIASIGNKPKQTAGK